jgi:hypothetical protein
MNMKKYLFILGTAISLLVVSCRKEYKEIGEVPSKIDGITANWVLSSCKVVDKASVVEEVMDITSFLNQSGKLPNVSFEIKSGIGTYTCDTSNVAYSFFGGTSGTWTFDNAEFPKSILIQPKGSTKAIVYPLAATIRPTDTYLQIEKSIFCNGTEKAVYRLSFIRN